MRPTLRKLILKVVNNPVINPILILFNIDGLPRKISGSWGQRSYDESKALSENVGYSLNEEIQETLARLKSILGSTAEQYLKQGDKILDIGCGPGMFLEPFAKKYLLFGIDVNASFIMKAKERLPEGHFLAGSYFEVSFEQKFDMAWLIGVLQYIEPSHLSKLIRKIASELELNGILVIHYPHALSKKDLRYTDLRFIRYSPTVLEQEIKKYFEVVVHHHFTDERTVNGYDAKHYFFPDGTNTRVDTNLNTYLLIAKKKGQN